MVDRFIFIERKEVIKMISCKKALEVVKALKPLCDEKCGEGDACSVACGQIDDVIEFLACLCSGSCQIRNGKLVDRRDKKDRKVKCEGGVCNVPDEFK